MNFLKLTYLIIFFNVVFPNKELITPAAHISTNEVKQKVVFIGFKGEPNKQKTAKILTLNEKNQIEENENFTFILSKEDEVSFFAAHYDDFLGDKNKELILISTSPTQGLKFYIWEETQKKTFKSLGAPHIVYEKNQPLHPKESIIVYDKNQQHKKIAIVFGSPNRKITLFEFKEDRLLQKNIAEDKLKNQAGTMVFKSFYNQETQKEELYILNNGQTKTLRKITETDNHAQEENFNILDPVKDFLVINKEKKLFLLPNNQIFFSNTQETEKLTGPKPLHKILFLNENEIFFLDKSSNIVVCLLNKDTNSLTFKQTIETSQNNQSADNISYLITEPKGIVVANSKNNINEIIFHSFTSKKEQKTENLTHVDSLIFITEEKNTLNINLDTTKQFLNLESLNQPESMTINLDKMQFEWTPSIEELGYSLIKYNIEYGDGSKIEEQSKEGKISVESVQKTITETSQHVVYVNAKPNITINTVIKISV